jgi:hypothetical protein
MIFFVDFIFAVVCGYFTISLPQATSLLVILQSIAIIVFYAAIWDYKPYSLHFVDTVFDIVKSTLERGENVKISGFGISNFCFLLKQGTRKN